MCSRSIYNTFFRSWELSGFNSCGNLNKTKRVTYHYMEHACRSTHTYCRGPLFTSVHTGLFLKALRKALLYALGRPLKMWFPFPYQPERTHVFVFPGRNFHRWLPSAFSVFLSAPLYTKGSGIIPTAVSTALPFVQVGGRLCWETNVH